MLETIEREYYKLIPWVAKETVVKLPEALHVAAGWSWDDHEERLFATHDGNFYTFHVELEVGRTRRHIATLSVSDKNGSVKWEAQIPAKIAADAQAKAAEEVN